MYKELMQAAAGKVFAGWIDRRNQADRYIFFPENKEAYLRWGVRLLPQYIKQNRCDRIVVIAVDDSVEKEMGKQGIGNIRFQKVSGHCMDCLMDYYALWDMSDKWIVVSTKKPYDTGAERLLGVKGVTYRDIVYYDVYKLD